MKKRQVLWAIAFGSMLAITGCGDDETSDGGSGGSGGSGGGGSSSICDTLCSNCGGAEADCRSACNDGIGDTGGIDLESCPEEQGVLGSCVSGNGCQSLISDCFQEYQDWILCIAGVDIPF